MHLRLSPARGASARLPEIGSICRFGVSSNRPLLSIPDGFCVRRVPVLPFPTPWAVNRSQGAVRVRPRCAGALLRLAALVPEGVFG